MSYLIEHSSKASERTRSEVSLISSIAWSCSMHALFDSSSVHAEVNNNRRHVASKRVHDALNLRKRPVFGIHPKTSVYSQPDAEPETEYL